MYLGKFAVTALVTVVVGGLSACASGSDTNTRATEPGTIAIAVEADVVSPDNVFMGGNTWDRLILASTVYEPLFTTDESGGLAPALATEATSSADLMTWTVSLRDDVAFSNGKEFTSEDVLANFDLFMNPDTGANYASDLEEVDSIEADGDYRVVFQLNEPDANFDTALQDTMFFADLDSRETGGLLEPGEVPVGTGPYAWKERVPGDSLTFEPYTDYWRGEPPLTEVTFRVIPEGQTAVIALQKGEVDIMANYVPPQSLSALESDPNINLASAEGSTFHQAYLNFEKDRRGGYADGEKVRQGLARLMNTQETIPSLIGGYGELATQPIPPWQAGYNVELQPTPYDEAEGKRLLAEGGIQEGDPIKLLVRQRPFLCEWATAIQSNLTSLGYDAQLECLDPAVAEEPTLRYDWDLLFHRTSGRANAAVAYQQRWGLALASPPTDTYTLQDPELQSMIDVLKATSDEAEFDRLGAEIAERIVVTDTAVIPGYFDTVYMPMRTWVTGFTLSPTTWYGVLYNAMGEVSTN